MACGHTHACFCQRFGVPMVRLHASAFRQFPHRHTDTHPARTTGPPVLPLCTLSPATHYSSNSPDTAARIAAGVLLLRCAHFSRPRISRAPGFHCWAQSPDLAQAATPRARARVPYTHNTQVNATAQDAHSARPYKTAWPVSACHRDDEHRIAARDQGSLSPCGAWPMPTLLRRVEGRCHHHPFHPAARHMPCALPSVWPAAWGPFAHSHRHLRP